MVIRNILVDGNNLLHRASAVFANGRDGEPLMSPTGYPTGIIYGCLNMLSDWVQDVSEPTRMDVFFDGVAKRRRVIDPDYKRKEEGSFRPGLTSMPLRLSDGFEARHELDILTHLFRLLGSDIYHDPDEEADDLIASYVAGKPNEVHVIISSDRDFYQLMADTDRVIMYRPGVAGNRFFDAERAEADMEEKFGVPVPPANIRMFKALTGDPSDCIPGILRLRRRVAAPLCSSKNVEDLYLTGFPGFSKVELERTLAGRERVDANFRLVGLDSSVDVSASKLPATPDYDAAGRILSDDLGIRSIQPHVFSFAQSRMRFGDSFQSIPDFLQDI